jgi:hypothetical protein
MPEGVTAASVASVEQQRAQILAPLAAVLKHATVGRCAVTGKTVEPEDLPAYAAVALAGLGHLPDTVASRYQPRRIESSDARLRRQSAAPTLNGSATAVIETSPGNTQEFIFTDCMLPPDDAHKIGAAIRAATASSSACSDVLLTRSWNRFASVCADVWEPLLLLADTAGGKWPEMARCCAVSFVTSLRGEKGVLGTRLLADVREAFKEGEDSLPTERLLTRLRELPESPWADLRGKPLTDRGLATRLRPYDVRSKVIRVGEKTLRGYSREDFYEAWRRSLSPSL